MNEIKRYEFEGRAVQPRTEGDTMLYVLIDPRTNEPRYVGKTRKTLSQRFAQHMQARGKSEKNAWIKALKFQRKQPMIRALEVVTDGAWGWREKWWIDEFRSHGCALFNKTASPKARDLALGGRDAAAFLMGLFLTLVGNEPPMSPQFEVVPFETVGGRIVMSISDAARWVGTSLGSFVARARTELRDEEFAERVTMNQAVRVALAGGFPQARWFREAVLCASGPIFERVVRREKQFSMGAKPTSEDFAASADACVERLREAVRPLLEVRS